MQMGDFERGHVPDFRPIGQSMGHIIAKAVAERAAAFLFSWELAICSLWQSIVLRHPRE
jgi:hypothetical protein